MDSTLKRTWVQIDLDNLAYNYQIIRRQIGPDAKMLGVIKADGYGHGAVQIARELEMLGASYLAVSDIDECEQLRSNGITLPILMLGFTPADQAANILRLDMTQALPNDEIARTYNDAAIQAGKKIKVHIKLDTGMGRLGYLCDDAHFEQSLQSILRVLTLPGLDVEGIFTHFSVSDEPTPQSVAFTKLQYARFEHMVRAIEQQAHFTFRLRHCLNAGGIAYYPQWSLDMVRCGIILYGAGELAARMGMKSVMSLKTTVSTVKEISADASISYGRQYFTKQESRIAVLPIGYADGLQRALSEKIHVQTPYGPARQVGRICMDMCMIDVTDYPQLRTGDEIEIFGQQIPVEQLACAGGTICYELLCAVSKRVPRIYIKSGMVVDRKLYLS